MVKQVELFKSKKNTERIVLFSDAIFAVSITLLVLQIPIPVNQPGRKLINDLVNQSPMFISYVVSFFVIGRFWIKHISFFNHIKRFNMSLVWLNFAYMVSVSFIPYPTAVYGTHSDDIVALIMYAAAIMVAGYLSSILWLYALRKPELLVKDVTSNEIIHHLIISLIMPTAFLISIFLVFINPVLVPFLWIIFAIVGSFLHRL